MSNFSDLLGVSPVPPVDLLVPTLAFDENDVEMVSTKSSGSDTVSVSKSSTLIESKMDLDDDIVNDGEIELESKSGDESDSDSESSSTDRSDSSRYLGYESDDVVYLSSDDDVSDDEKMLGEHSMFNYELFPDEVEVSEENEVDDVFDDLDDYMVLQQYHSKLEMLLHDPKFAFLRRDCSSSFKRPLFHFLFSFEFCMPRTRYVCCRMDIFCSFSECVLFF